MSVRIKRYVITIRFTDIKLYCERIKLLHSPSVNVAILVLFSSSVVFFPEAYAESATDTIPPTTRFSNFTYTVGISSIFLMGQFSNGDIPYKVIFLKMSVLDKNGHALATGYGNISDIKPHEIKAFSAITRFSGNFSSCIIQVDSAIPK